jgi:DNA transposition AAA+ family ATPase
MNPDDKQPMQQLDEQRRTLGASRVIRDGVAPEQVTADDRAEVIKRVGDYRARRGMTWGAVAKSVGLTQSLMSLLINNHTTPRWQAMVIDLDKWLEDQIKRDEASTGAASFIRTQVASEVFTVANAAIHLKSIGLIWGWSGLGKTMALKAIAAEKPGSLFVSISTADATPIGVARAIATAAHLRDTSSLALGAVYRRLQESLEGTNRLIIIDEIHKLCGSPDDRPLHVLRDLFDATGCPQLWSGTTDLIAYLDRRVAAGKEPLAQIRRRIGICRDLTGRCQGRSGGGGGGGGGGGSDADGEALFSIDEIRQVFTAGKMRLTPEAIRYLFILANLPESGGLGTCANLVAMAAKVNGRADVLTADMLRAVHRLLLSQRDYSLLQERMRETEPQSPARSSYKAG